MPERWPTKVWFSGSWKYVIFPVHTMRAVRGAGIIHWVEVANRDLQTGMRQMFQTSSCKQRRERFSFFLFRLKVNSCGCKQHPPRLLSVHHSSLFQLNTMSLFSIRNSTSLLFIILTFWQLNNPRGSAISGALLPSCGQFMILHSSLRVQTLQQKNNYICIYKINPLENLFFKDTSKLIVDDDDDDNCLHLYFIARLFSLFFSLFLIKRQNHHNFTVICIIVNC